jgi:hypothetical protein
VSLYTESKRRLHTTAGKLEGIEWQRHQQSLRNKQLCTFVLKAGIVGAAHDGGCPLLESRW